MYFCDALWDISFHQYHPTGRWLDWDHWHTSSSHRVYNSHNDIAFSDTNQISVSWCVIYFIWRLFNRLIKLQFCTFPAMKLWMLKVVWNAIATVNCVFGDVRCFLPFRSRWFTGQLLCLGRSWVHRRVIHDHRNSRRGKGCYGDFCSSSISWQFGMWRGLTGSSAATSVTRPMSRTCHTTCERESPRKTWSLRERMCKASTVCVWPVT